VGCSNNPGKVLGAMSNGGEITGSQAYQTGAPLALGVFLYAGARSIRLPPSSSAAQAGSVLARFDISQAGFRDFARRDAGSFGYEEIEIQLRTPRRSAQCTESPVLRCRTPLSPPATPKP
jgi:hypothetical protein